MAGSNIHTPVAEENCDECHNPHSDPPEETLACTDCHDTLLDDDIQHEPAVDDCSNCHETHSGELSRMLFEDVPDLCISCHDDREDGWHGEIRMNTSCLSCHNPHSSTGKALLADLDNQSCVKCHAGKTAGKYVHTALNEKQCIDCHNPHDVSPMPPVSCSECHMGLSDSSQSHNTRVEDRCTECHDPHSSNNPNTIKSIEDQSNDECLACHTSIQRRLEFGRVRHEAVSDGDCTDCHTIHIGEKPFTVERFSPTKYTPYTRDAYALCFECHEPSLVEKKFTQVDTGFRNGLVNLHYRHVYRDTEKGFSCWVCHDAHATFQTNLIHRETFYNPKYNLKIEIQATETGGKCFTNCHMEKVYQR